MIGLVLMILVACGNDGDSALEAPSTGIVEMSQAVSERSANRWHTVICRLNSDCVIPDGWFAAPMNGGYNEDAKRSTYTIDGASVICPGTEISDDSSGWICFYDPNYDPTTAFDYTRPYEILPTPSTSMGIGAGVGSGCNINAPVEFSPGALSANFRRGGVGGVVRLEGDTLIIPDGVEVVEAIQYDPATASEYFDMDGELRSCKAELGEVLIPWQECNRVTFYCVY